MTKDEIIRIGKKVLDIEADAVHKLASSLDESFFKAVDLLFNTKSRVIVIGMGKSGLVGRKLAATLSSCGTPAMFIHPAEAGHGDLGMIVKEDVLIAISYSGETKEIVGLLDFFKRAGIKIISITGDKKSRLAKYSDIVLEAKVEKEAEPNGLVPTASSTAALALGDAVAIALMKKKGFGENDFAVFHPKGEAGKKLLKVESLMHTGNQIACISLETPMEGVLQEMSKKKMGMTCVVDDAKTLVGIITDGDLRRRIQKFGKDLLKKTAQDCMSPNPCTVDKEDLAATALNIMEENKITSLVIKNKEGKIEGVVHLHDLWRTEMF
jgi:arabinose-5-phosphate isomerase